MRFIAAKLGTPALFPVFRRIQPGDASDASSRRCRAPVAAPVWALQLRPRPDVDSLPRFDPAAGASERRRTDLAGILFLLYRFPVIANTDLEQAA